MTDDPFGTGALRRAVTEAWRASPTRFREDANSEEDHARGYYRDRVVVELAQNAADAAARAGVPGRLVLRLEQAGPGAWRLVAANTGAPLDAAGVASLASLRASAKTEGSGASAEVVGRFGVGFAAVRSVADDVLVRSRDGGVRFSLDATRAELGRSPRADLQAAAGRGDALSVLRLPWPAPGTAPDEPDTVVELLLRDADAVAAVRTQLAAFDDALLLALPALDEVVLEMPPTTPRVLRDVGSRWRVHRASGPSDLDESLPVEARRPTWSVLWALPRRAGRAGAGVGERLHAPTPTDVRLGFPALLVASFPVDPGRRGVLHGPTSQRIATAAGRAYAELLGELGSDGPGQAEAGEELDPLDPLDPLDLVPTGLPASDVDAAIRSAAVDALGDAPVLAAAFGGALGGALGAARVAPRSAAFVAGPLGAGSALAAALGPASSATLVPVPVRHQALARTLGAAAVDLADLVEALPAEPSAVRGVLDALAPHTADPAVLEAVAGVRLPLADGGVSSGARGTVLLPAGHLAGVAKALGVRAIHPEAAHPLLERAGAVVATARGLLVDPVVRDTALAAADEVLDGDDADRLGEVLARSGPDLLAGPDPADVGPDAAGSIAAGTVAVAFELMRLAVAESGGTGLPFWVGELPVVADGAVMSLRETALPGTWAARHLDLAEVRDDVVERQGADLLRAAGARADLEVYRVADVSTPDSPDVAAAPDHGPDAPAGWLADWDEYLDHLADDLGDGVWIGDVEAVPDLDVLRDRAELGATDGQGAIDEQSAAGQSPLAAALARFAVDPDLRRALLTPVRSPDAQGREAPSYTAWFLRRRLGAPFALGDTPLLPEAPAETAGLDDDLRTALGGLQSLADLPGHLWPSIVERLPDPHGGGSGADGGTDGADGGTGVTADVAQAVWAGLGALARAGGTLDVLPDRLPAIGPAGLTVERTDDLAVASSPCWAQLAPVVPAPTDVAAALADLLDLPLDGSAVLVPDDDGATVELDRRVRALAPGAPATWRSHDTLRVEGRRVGWWLSDDGAGTVVVHATSIEGLARGLAELTGADALLLAAALRDPDRAEVLSAERVWGRAGGGWADAR